MSAKTRRAAELVAILEVASAKIDRFGWGNMDEAVKDQLCADWCAVLSQYTLDEVRMGVRAVFDAAGGNIRSINEHQVKAKIQQEHARQVQSLPRNEPEPHIPRDNSPEAVRKREDFVRSLGLKVVRRMPIGGENID